MDINALLDKCKLNEFVAIDLETTGLSPKEEYIIEVSAVRFINGKEHETFSFLLNPGNLYLHLLRILLVLVIVWLKVNLVLLIY